MGPPYESRFVFRIILGKVPHGQRRLKATGLVTLPLGLERVTVIFGMTGYEYAPSIATGDEIDPSLL